MVVEVRVSDEAKADLYSLWKYIASDNSEAADRQVQRILDVVDNLAHFPGSGTNAPGLAVVLKYRKRDKYLKIYRATLELVEIVRIIHSARNVPPLLNDR